MIMILSFNVSVNAQGDSLVYELDNDMSFVNNGWDTTLINAVVYNPTGFAYNDMFASELFLKQNFNLKEKNNAIFSKIEVSYTFKNDGYPVYSGDVKFHVIFKVEGVLVDSAFIDLTATTDSIYHTFTFGGDTLGVNKEVEIVIFNEVLSNTYLNEAIIMSQLTIKAIKLGFVSTQEKTTPNLTVFTSNKTVHISSTTDLNDSNVLIYNMNGQIVANTTESIYNDTQIDLNYLNNGMYVMVLLDETGNELVKQKISI